MGAAPKIEQDKLLGDLELLEVVGSGTSSLVYRAQKKGSLYAVKMSKAADPDGSLLRSFRTEAAILAQINHPALVQTQEVGTHHGFPYIVMEYLDGELLSARLKRGKLPADEIYTLALTLSDVLHSVHLHGVIHQDLKPENIYWNPKKGILKLFDFGLVGQQGRIPKGQAVGTLDYMSPEQLGILDRPIDARSDLYSLGITLLECVTHPLTIPQMVGRAAEAQFQYKPEDILAINGDIKYAFAKILCTLLKKDPDDRYANAGELFSEINRTLFTNNTALPEQTKLIGREGEKKTLLDCWEKCRLGTGTSFLVEGEAGAGKSLLVADLVQRAEAEEIVSLRGKCAQRLPFAPLRRLFAELQKKISREHPLYLKLRKDFRNKASSLRRVSPAFADHFGFGESEERASSKQERFFEDLADVFISIATHSSLILFVDDVQWIDAETLHALECLIPKLATSRLLLVMTSRNDFESLDSLRLIGERLKVQHKLSLGALNSTETAQLVRFYLGGQQVEDRFLDEVHKSTNGIPFAIGEYIRNVSLNGILSPKWGKWDIDWDGLFKLDLPSDVIELVRHRIEHLSSNTREALSVAATIGVNFHLTFLARVLNQKENQLLDSLTDGALQFLVKALGSGDYKFVHDRIHEAFQTQVGEEEKRALHQKIALALFESKSAAPQDTFAMADHFWDGYPDQNPKEVYEICDKAAHLAYESHALEKSHEYFCRAETIAEKAKLQVTSDQELIGAICTKIGKKTEAIQRFQTAFDNSRSNWAKAQILGRMAEAYVSNMETREGGRIIERAFAEIKLTPPSRATAVFSIVFGFLSGLVCYYTGFGYGKAKGEKRERLKMIVDLGSHYGFVKFFDLQPFLMAFSAFRNFYRVQQIGDSPELVNLYGHLGIVFGILKIKFFVESLYRRARLVAERLSDPQLIAHAEAYHCFALAYSGQEIRMQLRTKEVLHDYRDSLITEDYVYLCGIYMSTLTVRGYPAEALKCALGGLDHLAAPSEESSELRAHYMTWCQSYAVISLVMMGRITEAQFYLDALTKYFKENPNDKYHLGIHLNNLIQSHVEQGEYSDVVEREFTRHKELIQLFIPLQLLHIRHFYIAKAYIRFNQLHLSSRENRAGRLKAFKASLWELRLASDNAMFSSHFYTLRGAYQGYLQNFKKATKDLHKAEQLALECNNATALFHQNLTKARMERVQKRITASSLAEIAYGFCKNHNWVGRQWEIEKEFPEVRTARGTEKSLITTRTSGEDTTSKPQEMDALLRINLALSKSRDPAEQGQIVMDEVVRVIGAERGAFFLWDEGAKRLNLSLGRSSDGKTFTELKGYSSTVVDRVFKSQEPLIVSGSDEGEALGSASVVLFDLRSIIAAPISVSEKRLGVVYLDSRFARGIFNDKDLDFLRAVGIQIAIGIDSNRSALIAIDKVRIEKELELTGAVQRLLIPKAINHETDLFRLSYFFQTAGQSGGDWIWYESGEDGSLTVLLGDVVGHGPGAAMITAIVSGTFHAMREKANLPVILQGIHQVLKTVMEGEYWISLMAVHVKGEIVEVYNAGMPLFSFLDKAGKASIIFVPSTGPLGLDSVPVEKVEVPFQSGDRFMVCTDGAFEFTTKNGVFGERRLNRLFSSTGPLSLPDAREKIAQTILSEIVGAVADDVALVLVEKK